MAVNIMRVAHDLLMRLLAVSSMLPVMVEVNKRIEASHIMEMKQVSTYQKKRFSAIESFAGF